MYEIGDEVIYQGADKSAYKRRGVVAAIEEKDGKPQLTVAFEDGEEFTAPIDDWSRAFTNAAKNGVSPEMRMAVKLRLKQDFKDEYGSYRKGDVFQVYPYGFNPHHATLRVPGRQVTLEVPWDKVELVNSSAKNAKLKVGDEVKSKTFGKTFIERVIRVYPKARGLGYPPGRTENNFDWYETDHAGIFSENEVGVGKAHVPVSANSRSCNSTNKTVANALNARMAANANKFDGTPIDRFVRDTICAKFPESNLEGYTDGAVMYWTRGNGNKTILADKKARPALDVLKQKFGEDYIFTPVDYGRGNTGFSIVPRANAKRGEFRVENMLNARTAKNDITPYGAVSGILALKYNEKKDDVGNGVMVVRAPKDEVEKYLRARAGSYPYKIEPYRGGKWAKVIASTTLNARTDNASVCNDVKFTNPNYNPVKGMKYLEEYFSIFDPKVAKEMIDDAIRKGVKIPSGLLAKAKAAGMIANAAKNAAARNADVGSALKDAIAALRKLADVAKAEGNEKEHERAVKAGTILYGMKPAW